MGPSLTQVTKNAANSAVKKRVIIDARMVGPIPHGISRYVTSIAKGLELRHQALNGLPYDPIFLVQPDFPQDNFHPFDVYPVQSPFLNPKELIDIPKALVNLKANLYHSPSFSSLWRSPCPTVITIHDLNHLTYGTLSQKLYYQTLLRRFARHSLSVLTVSEFSRNEISKWLGIPSHEIEVTYNTIQRFSQMAPPHSPQLATQPPMTDLAEATTLEKYDLLAGQYFLCISNSKPHKNLTTLIKAYQLFRKQCLKSKSNARASLHESGHEPWPLVLSISTLNPDDKKMRGIRAINELSPSDVDFLLKNTAGFFFPSQYEGFGLPPVEAATAGVPLAVSDIPPHREGLVDLQPNEIQWVQPNDIHGWVSAFHKMYRKDILPPSKDSQNKVLNRFNVEKMGECIDRIYREGLSIP